MLSGDTQATALPAMEVERMFWSTSIGALVRAVEPMQIIIHTGTLRPKRLRALPIKYIDNAHGLLGQREKG